MSAMTRGASRTIVFDGPAPEIVCVVGAPTMADEVASATLTLALADCLVLVDPLIFMELPPPRRHLAERQHQLNLRRIDTADRMVVVGDDADPWVRQQVEYAQAHQVPVTNWKVIAPPEDMSPPVKE